MANELTIKGKPTATSLTLSKNITDEEWLEVGETLGKFEQSKMWWVGDWLKHKYPEGQADYGDLEDKTGLEHGTMKQALYVCRAVPTSNRFDALGFLHHAIVAPLSESEQKEWLTKALKEEWTVRQLRDVIRGSKTPKLSDGKYRVIYVDPPWQYNAGDQHSTEEQDTVIGTHYDSMADDQLLSLSVGSLAEESAVLFCWATSPNIPFALELIKAWGFEYKAQFVWDKVLHNVGHYNSVRHELLLICTKGSCLPDSHKLVDSVVTIERGEHSEKPVYFRELIDEMYPKGKRIELFARNELPKGWDGWGLEWTSTLSIGNEKKKREAVSSSMS